KPWGLPRLTVAISFHSEPPVNKDEPLSCPWVSAVLSCWGHIQGATVGIGGTDLSTQPESLLSENPVDLRWLPAVRGFALTSLLGILLSMYVLTVFGISSKEADPAILFVVLLFVPVCFPYAWIYWRLRSKIGKTVKKSLALSIGFGAFAL